MPCITADVLALPAAEFCTKAAFFICEYSAGTKVQKLA
jgi:hypothetical protein